MEPYLLANRTDSLRISRSKYPKCASQSRLGGNVLLCVGVNRQVVQAVSTETSANYTGNAQTDPPFEWDEQRCNAAIALAHGYTKEEVAGQVGCVRKTVYNWLAHPEFAAEVDRLSLMVGVASKAERLRIAQRVIRQKTKADGTLDTKADVLDWMKFAANDGANIKLELAGSGLTAKSEEIAPPPTPEPESVNERVN